MFKSFDREGRGGESTDAASQAFGRPTCHRSFLAAHGRGAAEPLSDELRGDLAAIAAVQGLTFAEAALRHDLRERSTPAVLAVAADGDSFAGAFQDDSDGTWGLHILYVGEALAARDRVAALVPDDVPVEWVRVQYSYTELSRIKAEIVELWQQIGLQVISAVSVHPPTNRVVVATPQQEPGLQAQLTQRYGQAVAFEIEPQGQPVACNSTNDPEGGSRYACTPWRGGIESQTIDGSHSNRCTMTMMAKRSSDSSFKYVITAGHCGSLGSHTFYHNGSTIGTSVVNSLNLANPRSDSRRIPASGSTSHMNRVYETPTAKSYAISSTVYWTNQNVNDWVCKLGVGNSPFGRSCGQIVDSDTTLVANGKVMPAKQADFNGSYSGMGLSGGDSGASVVYSGRLFGLAVLSDGRYSTAVDIEVDLGIDFCLDSSCTVP